MLYYSWQVTKALICGTNIRADSCLKDLILFYQSTPS